MKKRVIIIDDESDARLLIRQYIEPHAEFEVVAECDNGVDAVTTIDRLEPDLIFLDIKMPGLSGFQVVQQMAHVPQVVFTTAYDQYALRAFETNAIDYLLKPYTRERFDKALSKLAQLSAMYRERVQQFADDTTGVKYFSRILVEQGGKFVNIALNDILYIEAERDYARLHTETKTYLSNYGIGLLQQRMDPTLFIRIHRSYIVNISHIKELHKEMGTAQVLMKNGQMLNVSRTYMDGLKQLLY